MAAALLFFRGTGKEADAEDIPVGDRVVRLIGFGFVAGVQAASFDADGNRHRLKALGFEAGGVGAFRNVFERNEIPPDAEVVEGQPDFAVGGDQTECGVRTGFAIFEKFHGPFVLVADSEMKHPRAFGGRAGAVETEEGACGGGQQAE